MYLIVIAWMYVALMMAVAEATHANGSMLGAILTFLMYGVGPVALVVYLMGHPGRRRARLAREALEAREAATAAGAALVSGQPDGRSEPAADAVTPVRKEP